jgi:hypothetical protein
MRISAKKIIVYSIVGMMQFGLGVIAVSASPLPNDDSPSILILDGQHDYDQRQSQENERHEKAMHRRSDESDQEWNDRQMAENNRHNKTMNEIEAGLFGFVFSPTIN